MVKYKKDETSPEALERVLNTNVVVTKEGILSFNDFADELERQLPKGLKGVFVGETRNELTKEHFKDYLAKAPDNLTQAIGESDEHFEKRNKEYVDSLDKSRKENKVKKVRVSKQEQQKIQQAIEEQAKTFIKSIQIKQHAKSGKEYTRTFQRWTQLQLRFIQNRITMGNKELTNSFNAQFGANRTISSVKTMKLRLKKKVK
jgi:hypothetical protein